MASVRLSNVNKIYDGGFQAVYDANLEIEDGEFVVLVGPSGCGKSTTLRMIAGLEEISSGEIYIGDRLVNKVDPGNRDIAMVFQNYALYPHMSVRQNMAFGLRMRKVARAEIDKRVQNAAEILSIEPLLDRRPREMSGGQRQRVALGRAIVRDPQVFLFDEPLSNLDAKLRVQMRTEIARLHHRLKTTMIYVTHDQVEAMTLGDRIVIMKDGVIQQVDTPMQLYRQPANRFVAGFIGSPAMNFFEGQVRGGEFIAGDRSLLVGSDVPDGQVILGVRPEDLLISDADGCFADVSLDVVEHMGHETMVYFDLTGSTHVARLPAEAEVSAGDRLSLAIRAEAWHLFSATDRQIRLE
ncbi:MAG TPA: sn-glycerol-3-phosphate ABC transporter ATP-binding protein UgpC [Pirellulales bacterium]|nr:sn-glycerol-3-phosphate ABC transporter ATP-binding protein UgpC [Pirellulales bacterium]